MPLASHTLTPPASSAGPAIGAPMPHLTATAAPDPDDPAEWLTVREAAKRHQTLANIPKPVDVSCIYRWIDGGRLRAQRGPGVRTRVAAEDVAKLAAEVRDIRPRHRARSGPSAAAGAAAAARLRSKFGRTDAS